MIIFEVYYDDYEPWEYNRYTVKYYSNISDALKKQYKISLAIQQEEYDYNGKYCDINYIHVIDRGINNES